MTVAIRATHDANISIQLLRDALMARVFKAKDGYEFVHLSRIGMRLVNEFQRHNPNLCKPTEQPDYRYIRCGSQEQNRLLETLVVEVLQRDPEIQWKPSPSPKMRA